MATCRYGAAVGGAERVAAADRAVTRARDRLVGRRLGDVVVARVLHYGAVDLDARHLVVWVLLSGASPEELPQWWTPGSRTAGHPAPDLEEWATSMVAEVRRELAAESWPDPDGVDVMVDSDERVGAVGWTYFK